MTEYHKIDIEKNQEEAAKIRNEAIEIMNKIESGEKPKKFSDWVKKAKKRRKDAIKESTKNK